MTSLHSPGYVKKEDYPYLGNFNSPLRRVPLAPEHWPAAQSLRVHGMEDSMSLDTSYRKDVDKELPRHFSVLRGLED